MTAYRKAIFAIVLGLSSVLAACDSVEKLDQITAPPAPPALSYGSDPRMTTLLRTSAFWTTCVFQQVTALGGTIKYTSGTETVLTLVVPKQALVNTTYFMICPTRDGTLGFDFAAGDRNGSVRTFRLPLHLTISYKTALNLTATSRLRIVYAVNGTPVELLSGALDPVRRTVSANVFHFSTYVIGTD